MDTTLQAAAAAGKNNIVLDMAGVSYISSAGLRTLADIVTKNREAGGDLELVALNSKVLRIIGFDRFFAIYDSVDEAIADFGPPWTTVVPCLAATHAVPSPYREMAPVLG